MYDGLVAISSFIRQHQFLSADNITGASASTVSVQNYVQVMKDFEEAQFVRQKSGLQSNTSGASAADLQKIQDCHHDALQYGLNCIAGQDNWFDKTNLHSIHAKLCPDEAQSGWFRENKVRASNTLFTRPENIEEQFNEFSIAVKRFQTKWASSSSAMMNETQWVNHVYDRISLTAIIMFGIVNIHPFRDANGRTSRIYMNITLKRILGLPFPITVTAAEQRKEYINALKVCRSRLLSISKGENIAEDQSVFQYLIEFLVDRVLHAIVQVNSMVEVKKQSAAAADQARNARTFLKEQVATAQCCICLDSCPNIATLCCGQPVHLNCMAEWLSNQGTCITCRQPMPRMAPRTVNPATNGNNNPNRGNNEDLETTDDTDTTETTEDVNVPDSTTEDDTTRDDTTTSDDNDTQQVDNNTTEDSTTEDDTTNTEDDTTESVEPTIPRQRSRFCGHCHRNKFAVDCSNEFCGRCCQLYGSDHCVRHNC
jgi:fido (protein-threonine AMPylation protein)